MLTQALLVGFGLAGLLQEKSKKFVGDLKKDRRITDEKSRKAAKDLLKHVEGSRKDFEKLLRRQVQKVIDELNLATKDDLKKLRRR